MTVADPEALVGNFKNIKFTDDSILGRVRESLAEGIYQDVNSSFHVLRELAQNGIDAIKDTRKVDPHFEGEVRIKLSPNSIEVYDTGIGMSRKELHDVVGFGGSKKDPEFHIGFRGIGFWASSALASKVFLISKKRGEKYKHALLVDVAGWKKEEANLSAVKLLNKYVFEDDPAEEDTDAQYTMVSLKNLTESGKYLVEHKADAENYLRRTLPLEFEKFDQFKRREKIRKLISENVPDQDYETFRAFLDGKELFKPGCANLQDIIHDEIRKTVSGRKKKSDKVVGWYWAALNTEREQIKDPLVRGILYRVKGFAIGDENLLRNLFLKDKETPDWYYGEIYILDKKIMPDSSRTNFEGTPEWHEFVSALAAPGGLISKLKRERRNFSNRSLAQEEIPELVEESKNILNKSDTTTPSDVGKLSAKLKKRIVHATNPELKKKAQDTVKKLDRLEQSLSSGSSKAGTGISNSTKTSAPLAHFYKATLKILEGNISDRKLLSLIKKKIEAAYEEAQSG